MTVVELEPYRSESHFAKLGEQRRAESVERRQQAAAFVEAAVNEAIEVPPSDPTYIQALHIVAHSVKHLLSPRALAYLEGVLDSDARSGAIRWRELARLDLWLRRASLPVGFNSKKMSPGFRGYTRTDANRHAQCRAHPHTLFSFGARLTGRTAAAVYGIAKRSNVSPTTVLAALVNFGLERLTQALRESKEVPPTVSEAMSSAFPEAT